MKATFHVKIVLDYPNMKKREDMMRWVNTVMHDMNHALSDDVESIDLLNHTLVITDG